MTAYKEKIIRYNKGVRYCYVWQYHSLSLSNLYIVYQRYLKNDVPYKMTTTNG